MCKSSTLPPLFHEPLGPVTVSEGDGHVQKCYCGPDLRTLRQSRFKKPLRPATVNRELMCISGAFTEAMKRGYIGRNPVVGVPQLPEHNDRLRWLTSKEDGRPPGYAPEFLKPIILTALHAGMRRGEITRLKWADVDFDQRLIRVAESKDRKSVV